MFGNKIGRIEQLEAAVESLLNAATKLDARITVLENAVQCAAGNHVWEMRVRWLNPGLGAEYQRNLQMIGLGGIGSQGREEIYIGCKHCGTPKDKTNESA